MGGGRSTGRRKNPVSLMVPTGLGSCVSGRSYWGGTIQMGTLLPSANAASGLRRSTVLLIMAVKSPIRTSHAGDRVIPLMP